MRPRKWEVTCARLFVYANHMAAKQKSAWQTKAGSPTSRSRVGPLYHFEYDQAPYGTAHVSKFMQNAKSISASTAARTLMRNSTLLVTRFTRSRTSKKKASDEHHCRNHQHHHNDQRVHSYSNEMLNVAFRNPKLSEQICNNVSYPDRVFN